MVKKENCHSELPHTVERILTDLSLYKIVPSQRSKVKLPPPDQMCIVVRDIEKAVEYYSSIFGWGPFYITETEPRDAAFWGDMTHYRLKLAFAQLGPIEIELIQVLEGETAHTKFLEEKGEGLHHLRFVVDDLDGLLEKLAEEGIEPIWRWGNVVLLNSDETGGVIFELIQLE